MVTGSEASLCNRWPRRIPDWIVTSKKYIFIIVKHLDFFGLFITIASINYLNLIVSFSCGFE